MKKSEIRNIVSKIEKLHDGLADLTVNSHDSIITTDGEHHCVRAILVRNSKKIVFVCDSPVTTHFVEQDDVINLDKIFDKDSTIMRFWLDDKRFK